MSYDICFFSRGFTLEQLGRGEDEVRMNLGSNAVPVLDGDVGHRVSDPDAVFEYEAVVVGTDGDVLWYYDIDQNVLFEIKAEDAEDLMKRKPLLTIPGQIDNKVVELDRICGFHRPTYRQLMDLLC